MSKILARFFIVVFALFLIDSNMVSFAVEETEKNAVVMEKETPKVISGKITFDEISKKAKKHSYDLQLADFDIMIAKQGIRSARSEYFPKIAAMASTEYTKNFKDYAGSTVTTVGDSFINPYTRFQSLFGVTLSYNVFDFGARRNALDAAKEDSKVKELILKEEFQNLDLNLIDTYCKLLITKKQIEINNKILELTKNNLEMKERLFNAQEISKIEYNDAKVAVKKIEQRLEDLSSIAQESLNWISFYTGEQYNLAELDVQDFKKPDFDPMEFNDYTKSITWQIQEHELKKKELELRIAKKNYLPKVNAYSRYYVYGSDHSSYRDTIDDISPSNWTIGGTVYMPVFDGFQTSAGVQTASLELKKQFIQRDKAIAELMTRLSTMRSNLMYMERQVEDSEELLAELIDKHHSTKRLADKKEVTPIQLNEVQIELLEQEIELAKNASTAVAILKGIQTLTTY